MGPFPLILSLILIWSMNAFASGDNICAAVFAEANKDTKTSESLDGSPRPFSFQEKLISKGLDQKKLSFRLYHSDHFFVELDLYYADEALGKIKGLYNPDLQVFESHVSIHNPGFRGKGLGLLLYVALAKKVYTLYQTPLVSSLAPSPDAQALWQSIVKNGWGAIHAFPGGPRYYFFPAILADKFADVLQFTENNIRTTR